MSHPFTTFYPGKRVLVTGHTGFAGGWAAAWLKLLGSQVYGYGLPPATRPNFFDATLLDRGMTSIFADVRDRNSLANAFAEFQPEIVIHCASRSNPQLAQREPVETFSTNVMGTVFILEEARLTQSVRAVVNVSGSWRGESDDRSQHGKQIDVHQASMKSSELATSAFSNLFLRETKTAAATARSADAIGGGDWRAGRIVPNLVRSLISGEPDEVGDSTKFRIWHVLDEVHAYLLLAQRLFEGGHEYSGAWDFGPEEEPEVPTSKFAQNFMKCWESTNLTLIAPQSDQARSQSLKPSHHPSKRSLGSPNLLKSEEAIAWTVEWYRAFYGDASAGWRVTDEQIDRYMRMCGAGAYA